jgi:phage terminase small subunit
MKTAPTAKQQRFIDEYLVDLNATAAAIRAGYSSKTARQIASETLAKPYIQEAVAKAKLERSKATKIDAEWVLRQAVDLHLRCMQEIRPAKNPNTRRLIKDEEGNQLFTFNAAGASRALELVGKHVEIGAFKERLEVSSGGPSLIERIQAGRERARLRPIDPKERGMG